MTYQVSYCIYTAATVDVLDMRRSEASARIDAARRLGMAVRTLQEEAKHTPGSGRSLDTIRRLLTVWERSTPLDTMQSETYTGLSIDSGTEPQSLGPVQTEEAQNGSVAPPSLQAAGMSGASEYGNSAAQSVNEGAAGFLSRYQSPFSFGILDTGAGFHPDSFPWDLVEFIGNSQMY